ncbi:MAG: hypothetical protein M5U27_16950 [Gaiella sp.]|nr:hypothetical protein [Gaiella sp.]
MSDEPTGSPPDRSVGTTDPRPSRGQACYERACYEPPLRSGPDPLEVGGRLFVFGEAALENGAGDNSHEPPAVDDGHPLCVLVLDEAKCSVQRGVRVDRVVRRLRELAHARRLGVSSLGHDAGDERLAGDDAEELSCRPDDVDGPHLGRSQHLARFAGRGGRRQ